MFLILILEQGRGVPREHVSGLENAVVLTAVYRPAAGVDRSYVSNANETWTEKKIVIVAYRVRVARPDIIVKIPGRNDAGPRPGRTNDETSTRFLILSVESKRAGNYVRYLCY